MNWLSTMLIIGFGTVVFNNAKQSKQFVLQCAKKGDLLIRKELLKKNLPEGFSHASCHVQPNSNSTGSSNIQGYIYMRQRRPQQNVQRRTSNYNQPCDMLEYKTNLSGFPREGLYGIHVHELADFHDGCNSFGGHYNPYGEKHSAPEEDDRHVGDWGNLLGSLEVDEDGFHQSSIMNDRLASLYGLESIVGRGIVIHAGMDDLGMGNNEESLKTGNAGERLACCVIGWSNRGKEHWQ